MRFFHHKDTKAQRLKPIDSKGKLTSSSIQMLGLRCFMLILLSLMLFSCKDKISTNFDETRITEIMYNMQSAFNNHDIDDFMSHFSSGYLHDGQGLIAIREVWLNRMAEYLLVDFLDVTVDQNEDRAVVSFRMKLANADTTIYSDEPATHGDVSYFIYENSSWQIYGNQQSRK